MNRLRDALLSPSPKGPPELMDLDEATRHRQDTIECIGRGELDEVRGAAFYNRTWIISDRYCNVGDGVDSLEGYLHNLWFMYCQLGQNTSHETCEHDRLVLDIIRIQGLGPLTRPVPGLYGIDIARTDQGVLWNDLPYLVTDMTEFWINNCAFISGAQRLNLASFTAKLASTRVGKDGLCQIALVLFRATFEDRRELRYAEDTEKEDTHRSMKSLDIAHLLPAVSVWIKEAGYALIQLSDVSWNDCPSEIGQGGRNYVESDIGKRSPTGFTPWRYMFWLKRLHEIKEDAKAANEEKLLEYATDCIEFMVNKVQERNSGILRAYQNGGDALLEDKHLSCLKNDAWASHADE